MEKLTKFNVGYLFQGSSVRATTVNTQRRRSMMQSGKS